MRAFLVAACCAAAISAMPADSMDGIAERYVKLVLALGQHDADYVDAFYGPVQWKVDAERQKLPLSQIDDRTDSGKAVLASAKAAFSARAPS